MLKTKYNITNPQGAHLMFVVAKNKRSAYKQARRQYSGKLVVVATCGTYNTVTRVWS